MKRLRKIARRLAKRGPLLCLLLAHQAAAAQFVEIAAQIELTTYPSGKTNIQSKPRFISVLCTAGTKLWRIENDWSANAVNKWYFDGTNVYSSTQIVKPLSQETQDSLGRVASILVAPFDPASKDRLAIGIWPSADGCPLGDNGVNLPWLAFCSGAFLKQPGRVIPLPCDILQHTPDRYAYSDQTETFQDELGLPRTIDLYFSKSDYLVSIEGFYKGWGSRHLEHMKRVANRVDEGTLMFHYEVKETTNFIGWTLPMRFEFFQQRRPFIQNGDWSVKGVGTATSIREVAAPEGVFDSTLQQNITDYRFDAEATGMFPNSYTWTNAFVPDVTDPMLRAMYTRYKERMDEARRQEESTK